MASRLVPDFPAVLVALEHIKELEKELKDEGVAFFPEASVHLAEITSAVTGLEAERREAHEHLEVATIENSKLRHEINTTRDHMSAVIVADVAAARAANAEEIEQLRRELHAVSQTQEETVRKHEEVMCENELRSIERDKFKARHQEVIASLNNERTHKHEMQLKLEQTKRCIDELKASIASLELDTSTLKEVLESEKEVFAKCSEDLSSNFAEIEKRIQSQELENLKSRKQLDLLSESNKDRSDSLDELCIQTVKVQGSIQRLQESKSRSEKTLEAQKEKAKELMTQKDILEKQLDTLIKAFHKNITKLKEQIATIEQKMVGARVAKLRIHGTLDQVYALFKVHDDEETEVRTEYDYVSGKLEKSMVQLEERVGSIVRHKKDIEEMEKQIEALEEADFVNKRVFELDKDDLCGKLNVEKQQTEVDDEEKKQLLKVLKENKRTQEEFVKAMTAKIKSTQRKVKELQKEESALKKEQLMTADEIKHYIKKSLAEYELIEGACRKEIQQCANDVTKVMKTCKEKQNEVAEKQEILKRVEAKWNEELNRHEQLKKQETEFRMKKRDLEESIKELKKETVSLLEPKEEMKVELERVQAGHMDQLRKQAAELKSVEMCIYDSGVKLEQVRVENSRLHLRITQMNQDMTKAKEGKERYHGQTEKLTQDAKVLLVSLQEAWRDELLMTQERHRADEALMVPMDALQRHLKTRGSQLGHVQTMLHQQMLDFSRRLGDKITEEPQS